MRRKSDHTAFSKLDSDEESVEGEGNQPRRTTTAEPGQARRHSAGSVPALSFTLLDSDAALGPREPRGPTASLDSPLVVPHLEPPHRLPNLKIPAAFSRKEVRREAVYKVYVQLKSLVHEFERLLNDDRDEGLPESVKDVCDQHRLFELESTMSQSSDLASPMTNSDDVMAVQGLQQLSQQLSNDSFADGATFGPVSSRSKPSSQLLRRQWYSRSKCHRSADIPRDRGSMRYLRPAVHPVHTRPYLRPFPSPSGNGEGCALGESNKGHSAR